MLCITISTICAYVYFEFLHIFLTKFKYHMLDNENSQEKNTLTIFLKEGFLLY